MSLLKAMARKKVPMKNKMTAIPWHLLPSFKIVKTQDSRQ